MSWRKFLSKTRRHGSALPEENEPAHSESHESCACDEATLRPALECVADSREIIVLHMLREVFAGFCTGKVEHWNFACDQANDVTGEEGGVVLFAHVLGLARAIKSDRIGTFFFQPGGCSRMTDDEVLMIRMVQAGRRNNHFELTSLAETMAQGGALLHIQYAAFRLGILVETVGQTSLGSTRGAEPRETPSTLH